MYISNISTLERARASVLKVTVVAQKITLNNTEGTISFLQVKKKRCAIILGKINLKKYKISVHLQSYII